MIIGWSGEFISRVDKSRGVRKEWHVLIRKRRFYFDERKYVKDYFNQRYN